MMVSCCNSELIPIFVGSDVVNEFHSQDGAVTIIERRCKLNVDIPYLLKKVSCFSHPTKQNLICW